MTFIETLIVTATGLMIGYAILVVCVGAYSAANIGVFDYRVNNVLFYVVIGATALFGFIAGILPSFITIAKLKRLFRVE